MQDDSKDLPMDWKPFMGNNHARLPDRPLWGGCLEFAHHIGKPLTERLWMEITRYTRVRQMRIFRPNDAMWCDAPGNIIYIHLDENGNVKDLRIRFPWVPLK